MARKAAGLTVRTVETAKAPGYYADGGGLYLQVTDGGRSWIFRYQIAGRRRDMGLGPVDLVTLAEAREKALAARRLILNGADPIEARRATIAAERLDAAKAMTFSACAEAYIEAHKAGWRGGKSAEQWQSSLAAYVTPIIGALPVQAVDVALVMKVVEPIWTTKTETASRVRGRIEAVLDWAAARGYRQGDNPARWRGHLENLLARPGKVQRVAHHPALPYAELGEFMAALRAQKGIPARALEFLILTAARSGEVIGARWSEIDLGAGIWTVPAERIKGGREHRVPLSAPALAIVRDLAETRHGDLVFPSGKRGGKTLSNRGMLSVLERMGRADITAHGFRSTFRDWAAELTNFPSEVAEMALAHAVSDKVEAAYRRGDMFSKRRRLADAWAEFCAMVKRQSASVARIGRA
jgi:integrase